MEPLIRRVNFFDGQFLKQGEFQAEQLYHRHMRQRLNYILFNRSGVVPVTPDDLTFFNVNASAKTFGIRAGMAISRKADSLEGVEIILREDSEIFDLNAEGIGAGGRAWVTVHYDELQVADPPSDGDVDAPTRVNENAVLTVHATDPSASSPANGEEYIILGSLAFDDMAADMSQRQFARISADLVEGAGPAPAPTIAGINPAFGTQGATVNATITGTNLNGASSVTFSGSGVSATILAGGTPASLPVEVTITGGAAATARTFTVTTPGGAVDSAVASIEFEVQPALGVPVINNWPTNADRRRHGTEELTVFGENFADPMQVSFAPANAADPRVVVTATVVSLTEATAIVPGPFIPNPPADPAIVASGPIRVITAAGESADSTQFFVLEIV